MPEYAVPTPKRRRGRPRGGESGARERIIAAAVEEFGELGYDGATMRGIAARAGVDAALVHHYFGTKADLFAETVGAPMRPDVDIPALLDGPAGRAGRAHRPLRARGVGAPRDPQARGACCCARASAIGSPRRCCRSFLQRELFGRIAARLDTPDAALPRVAGREPDRRATDRPLRAAAACARRSERRRLVARVGPTVQHYLSTDRAAAAAEGNYA